MPPRGSSKAATLSRKVIERNRRILTKDLLSNLASLINPIPPAPAPKWTSMELLDQAIAYVKQLQQQMLKLKKEFVECSSTTNNSDAGVTADSPSTLFTVTDLDFMVEVCLSCRLKDKSILSQVIDVLEEEAAPVVAVSYSCLDDKINYIIHSQIVCSRIGIDSSRVHERLKRLTTAKP